MGDFLAVPVVLRPIRWLFGCFGNFLAVSVTGLLFVVVVWSFWQSVIFGPFLAVVAIFGPCRPCAGLLGPNQGGSAHVCSVLPIRAVFWSLSNPKRHTLDVYGVIPHTTTLDEGAALGQAAHATPPALDPLAPPPPPALLHVECGCCTQCTAGRYRQATAECPVFSSFTPSGRAWRWV